MATMKDIIQSPLLLALVIGGLLYISAFSLVYLKKAYDHCLELGITRKELSNVIKSSLIFSVVPSLSIVVGLFVLIAVLGSVWAWWRLSVIGSLSYETMPLRRCWATHPLRKCWKAPPDGSSAW